MGIGYQWNGQTYLKVDTAALSLLWADSSTDAAEAMVVSLACPNAENPTAVTAMVSKAATAMATIRGLT